MPVNLAVRYALRILKQGWRPCGLCLVFAGCAATAYAGGPLPVPEIDPGSTVSALVLLTGGLLLLADRCRCK
jgi:hypothetical protein